ncbi:MAG: four helix bundle protein [Acidobacteria bacterium]|nr:four helix bundle protein [Acidobacteriota bacterium]
MTHKDLDVWKESIRFVKRIYQATSSFPKSELYGITNQMRRSAVSIPSNISEGAARGSTKEFIRFLYISLGSLSELETQLIVSKELGYDFDPDVLKNLEEIRKRLFSLIRSLKQKLEGKE